MNIKLLLPGVMLAVAAAGASAASVEELTKECNDCHGDNGVSQWSEVPTIAGISPFVLSDALLVYQEKGRPCEKSKYRQGDTDRPETDMCEVVADLSEDEIEALAEHYAELEFVAAKQPFDAALAAAGKAIHDRDCENCHADSARDPEEDAGILAGQWSDYLREQFEHYVEGTRGQPEKMEAKVKALSAEDIEALINFYASLQ